MKKIITIIFCLLVSTTMMGQVSTTVVAQHLEFMGISIDGDINNFLGELEKKGYKLHKTDPTDNSVTMRGNYNIIVNHAMFDDDCIEVTVYYSPITHTVYCVMLNLRYSYDYEKQVTNILEQKYKNYLQDRHNDKHRWGCYKVDSKGNKIGRIFYHVTGDRTAEVTYTDLYNQKTDVREAIVARKYTLISKSL